MKIYLKASKDEKQRTVCHIGISRSCAILKISHIENRQREIQIRILVTFRSIFDERINESGNKVGSKCNDESLKMRNIIINLDFEEDQIKLTFVITLNFPMLSKIRYHTPILRTL